MENEKPKLSSLIKDALDTKISEVLTFSSIVLASTFVLATCFINASDPAYVSMYLFEVKSFDNYHSVAGSKVLGTAIYESSSTELYPIVPKLKIEPVKCGATVLGSEEFCAEYSVIEEAEKIKDPLGSHFIKTINDINALINSNLPTAVAAKQFKASAVGNISLEKGVYEFTLISNDPVKLEVNDVQAVDKFFAEALPRRQVSRIEMETEGLAKVKVDFEHTTDSTPKLNVSWRKVSN